LPKLPLITGVLKYTEENNISFCMPGHKGGKGLLDTAEGKRIYDNLTSLDITEVEGVDNLHHPEGIIKESQQLLSEYYGSRKSYYLVNGSTGGNLAMVFSAFEEGDKVIIERNCHRSLFNALILRKLNPLYVQNKISSEFDVPLSMDIEHLFDTMRKNPDTKGIIITYPNYYGICTDLKRIISEARKYGMKVLVDSAHGAHFGAADVLPESAVALGAQITVMSAHKTLPSFNQSAFLHAGEGIDTAKTDLYASMFMSTSPSYMLLCSMEYARFYLQEKGMEQYALLAERLEKYRKKINSMEHLHILGIEDKNGDIYDIDCTRFIISLEKGFSGHKLFSYLKSKGIQAEMKDNRNVVLIFSPFNTEEELEVLYKALSECDFESLKEKYVNLKLGEIPQLKLKPFEALNLDKELVPMDSSSGRICCEAVVPYPPGIPILNIGEAIDENAIRLIKYYLENEVTVLGVKDGKLYAAVQKPDSIR
jgi:arginine/lysine/ornithine decarboxylase